MESCSVKIFDTLVIGAGPAGLTTAYQLVKADRSVHVIEQDPTYVGGISRTVDYKGFLFDIGGHRFFSKSKEVVDLWNEILPDDFIDRPQAVAHLLQRQVLRLSAQGVRGVAQPRPARERRLRRLLRPRPADAGEGAEDLSPMGAQPVRRAALLDLLQDLHREGVGHGLRRDLGRLGGPAHQGPVALGRRHRRAQALAQARQGQGARRRRRQVADRELPLSPPRPRHDVGGRRRQDQGDGRDASPWAPRSTRSRSTRPPACGR